MQFKVQKHHYITDLLILETAFVPDKEASLAHRDGLCRRITLNIWERQAERLSWLAAIREAWINKGTISFFP